MASRSLGVLTLDLIAKIGGFEQGMDRAARISKQRMGQIGKDAKNTSQLIRQALAVATGGAGFALFIKNTVDAQNEQAQLAAVLRSTGEAAGYSQAKLNDMAEGMARASTVSAGEITSAQTALLAFTGIAGEEFPRALQAAIDMASRTGISVVSAAETIGRALDIPSKGLSALSRQGFRFTDDQRRLAEQLEKTGKTADAQGIVLGALEESYGGAATAAKDTFGGALSSVRNALNDLFEAGPGAIDPVTESMNELTDVLRDPATAQAVQTLTSAMITAFTGATSAISGTLEVTRYLAEELAARIHGPAIDDLVRLQERLDRLQDQRNTPIFLRDFIHVTGDGILTGTYTDAQLDAQMRELSDALKAAYDRTELPAPELSTGGTPGPSSGRASAVVDVLPSKEFEKLSAQLNQQIALHGMVGEAAKIRHQIESGAIKDLREGEAQQLIRLAEQYDARGRAIQITKEQEKAAEQLSESLASELTALERAAVTWGMNADEVKLYDLALQGADDTQLDIARSLLDTVTGMEQQKEAQEKYLKVVADLRTEEEQRSDTLREQLAIIEAMAAVPSVERSDQISRAAAGAFEDSPDFAGVGEQAGGFLGEFAKLDDAERELDDWYGTQLEMLNQFREERADLSAEWDEQELALKQQHEDSMYKIEQARRIAGLNAMGDFFGQIATLRDSDSKKGRALAKQAAIAQATINAYTAATGAYASASSIPVVGWILGPIAAAAALAAGIANINAIKGQAHDGIMSVPASGTWNLEKGERVLTQDTSASLDKVLADIQSGRGADDRRSMRNGSVTVNQTINTTGRIDARTSNQLANDAARKQRTAQARLG